MEVNKMKKNYYKVMERLEDGTLVSALVFGTQRKTYSDKFWTKPFKYMLKKNLGIFVFSNFTKAKKFIEHVKEQKRLEKNQFNSKIEIWSCEIGKILSNETFGICYLYIFELIKKNFTSLFYKNQNDDNWPKSTVITDMVKLK
jgi:hypothetical protein